MKRLLPLFLSLLFLCSTCLSFAACTEKKRFSSTTYGLFDTVITVTGYARNEKEFSAASDLAVAVLREYHTLTDIYTESDTVINLATVNAHAAEVPVAVGEKLYAFLTFAKNLAADTGGACDLTLGAPIRLWKAAEEDTENGNPRIPTAAALSTALSHTGWEKLVLSDVDRTVFFTDPALSLDVGATAKGYAVDMAAAALTDAGYTGYLIDAGGNLYAAGKKPEGAFRVGVRNPSAEGNILIATPLTDEALVTAGSYLRYFTVNGVRYHHILSPGSGMPATDFLSVSVKHESSATADGYATALFAMGSEAARAFLVAHPTLEVFFVYADGSTFATDGFA